MRRSARLKRSQRADQCGHTSLMSAHKDGNANRNPRSAAPSGPSREEMRQDVEAAPSHHQDARMAETAVPHAK